MADVALTPEQQDAKNKQVAVGIIVGALALGAMLLKNPKRRAKLRGFGSWARGKWASRKRFRFGRR